MYSSPILLTKTPDGKTVVTPEPDSTRLMNSNQNLGDDRLIILFYILLSFLFQKCRDPNPRLDPSGGFEPKPGLLRRFQVHPARRFIRYIDSIQDVKNWPIRLPSELSFIFIRFSNFSYITFQFHIHFRNIISNICSIHIIFSDLFGNLPKHLK